MRSSAPAGLSSISNDQHVAKLIPSQLINQLINQPYNQSTNQLINQSIINKGGATTPFTTLPSASHSLLPVEIIKWVSLCSKGSYAYILHCQEHFLATLVALHFTPVSEWVSRWAEFRTSVASRLASLFGHKEWRLIPETLKTFDQRDVKRKRQKDKRIKRQKENSILWCKGSFALLRCFFFMIWIGRSNLMCLFLMLNSSQDRR